MFEYWILWACALAASLIGLASNIVWMRKYDALRNMALNMNRRWSERTSRHNHDWAQKCAALVAENERLREQLKREAPDA